MENKFLIHFERSSDTGSADRMEETANFCLGLLRLSFGKTVKVTKMDHHSDHLKFENQSHHTAKKIASFVLFLLFLPLTVPIALAGCIATSLSNSANEITHRYKQKNSVTKSVKGTIKPDKTKNVKKRVRYGAVEEKVYKKDDSPTQINTGSNRE